MEIYRDPQKITEYLTAWIREKFGNAGAKGAVLGISGGIDSSVLAALLARALGAENVIGVIMPCHSMSIDEEYALLLAESLGIKTIKTDLSAAYDALEAEYKRSIENLGGLASANIKPRLRMLTLYAVAQHNGYLVCGGGNKDEITYGYFTKYGDSGVDLLPLADLLKGEVWAVAKYLGVPQEIIDRPPTAALWEGQTDEKEMGLTYAELDRYIACGEARPEVKEKIENAKRRSAHKRVFPPMAKLPEDI
ncbi:MAG: NAD(+) synthase [Synergistes sp.]|nr:NAD(+) synthase [Synergistes sp.]MCR5335090.1 NAD(+) synthase [Synergistes sp.]